MKMKCTLCGEDASLFKTYREKNYYSCVNCRAVVLHPDYYPSPEVEKKRYLEHNNDVDDPKYQKFVEPVVSGVKEYFTPDHSGLDFGAGTGPVITKLLRESGYNIKLYDPYFWNEPERLEDTYDYIAACEVIEHFVNPYEEFKLLKSLLKNNGKLFCKTSIFSYDMNFEEWKYKDDFTHLIFYNVNSLKWIEKTFKFSKLTITDQLIVFNA
jgi:2-polyprenyl-3-methyl-5-hydroxy-6-metoxy-1,4-benzoquinol methylase